MYVLRSSVRPQESSGARLRHAGQSPLEGLRVSSSSNPLRPLHPFPPGPPFFLPTLRRLVLTFRVCVGVCMAVNHRPPPPFSQGSESSTSAYLLPIAFMPSHTHQRRDFYADTGLSQTHSEPAICGRLWWDGLSASARR
ncbi:hypothetical protein AAHC03_05546 [Spirometra sp. Aus1]